MLAIWTKWRSHRLLKIAINCALVCLFGMVFEFAIFPAVLRTLVGNYVALKPGSEIRKAYTNVPFAITVKVYVFNVTNADRVDKGAKPILQQIGPYYFDEFKDKYEMVDNEYQDSLEYRMTNTFVFRPDLTDVGLTGDEVITTIHPLLAGMALAVNVDKKLLLPMTSNAIKHIFHHPVTPFWTGRVMDLLFDGIDIDCSSENYAARGTCAFLSADDVKAVRVINPELLKFSILGGANATSLGVFKVHRGAKNYRDVGRMIAFNGELEMDTWGTGVCNQFRGTDSSIFPPGLSQSDGLWAFEPSLCLSLGASYVGPSEYDGIPTREYTFEFGDAKNDKSLQCLCLRPPTDCPRAGTINLFQCVGTTMVISLPHFYKADSSILQQFDGGLNPNRKEHDVFVHFEPVTGLPLSASRRLQFSLDIVPIAEVECMKNMPEILLPIFWMEESIHLNKTYTNALKQQLFLPIDIVAVFSYFCIMGGSIGFALAVLLHIRNQNKNKHAIGNIDMKNGAATRPTNENVDMSFTSKIPNWNYKY